MAQVQAIETNGAAQPPPSKRAHVRTGKKPTGKPVTRDQSESPPDALAIDDMNELGIFEMMARYPAEEWDKKLNAYLYRLAPVIDRGKTGNYHNVQMYSKPVTQDEIMRATYGGSGKYRLMLKRYDPGTRVTGLIREEDFSILNQDFPPCIPMGEWIDDDKNREWAWAKPQLQRIAADKANQPATPAAAAAAGITDPTFLNVLAILERFMPKQSPDQTQALATEVMTTMREQHKEQLQAAHGKPDQLVTLVTTIAGVLKGPEKAGGGDPMIMAMLENMREDLRSERERNAKLMERLLTPPAAAAAPRSLAQDLKEMIELKGSIGALFGRSNSGGDGASKRTDWGEVVARSVEKIVEEGPRYMQAIFTGRPPARTIQTRPVVATPGAPAAPGDEQRGEPTPAEMEEQAMLAVREINEQFGATFDEFTPELAKTFDRDLSGMDFRDWFIEEFGARVYAFLRKMDVRTILGVIELRKTTAPDHLRPQLALLTPPAKVEKFILEFQSADPAPNYNSDDEELGDAGAGAPATAPREKEF